MYVCIYVCMYVCMDRESSPDETIVLTTVLRHGAVYRTTQNEKKKIAKNEKPLSTVRSVLYSPKRQSGCVLRDYGGKGEF